MTRTDHDVLTELEQEATARGASWEDLDARVAAALGVPADYLFAYQLVAGAIEAHRRAEHHDEPPPIAQPDCDVDELLQQVGWTACRVYQQAGELHRAGLGIARLVDALLGDLAVLRDAVAVSRAAAAPASTDGGGA
jgi:transcriptional regulator with XRE-family HTH domain